MAHILPQQEALVAWADRVETKSPPRARVRPASANDIASKTSRNSRSVDVLRAYEPNANYHNDDGGRHANSGGVKRRARGQQVQGLGGSGQGLGSGLGLG